MRIDYYVNIILKRYETPINAKSFIACSVLLVLGDFFSISSTVGTNLLAPMIGILVQTASVFENCEHVQRYNACKAQGC